MYYNNVLRCYVLQSSWMHNTPLYKVQGCDHEVLFPTMLLGLGYSCQTLQYWLVHDNVTSFWSRGILKYAHRIPMWLCLIVEELIRILKVKWRVRIMLFSKSVLLNGFTWRYPAIFRSMFNRYNISDFLYAHAFFHIANLATYWVFHKRTKHIGAIGNFTKDEVLEGFLYFNYIPPTPQLVKLCTSPYWDLLFKLVTLPWQSSPLFLLLFILTLACHLVLKVGPCQISC